MPEYVNYNPDVLSCLANLSNDEVFTPPEIANAMLDMLPQELFEDPNAKFLDPACKTGVFLREIAKRLLKGLEKKIPNLQERIDHIFHEQLYAIAITELTALMSRRSVYCTKAADSVYSVTPFENKDGNIRFQRTEHTWDSKGKDAKCIYCGASREQFDRGSELETHAYEFIHIEDIYKMKFDLIISNPPYQLNVGVEKENYAIPIYQKFVEQAKKLHPRYISMIVPSRWFTGGRGLDDFRESMLNDNHIRRIVDYPNPYDCFQGVDISGGICYFLWTRDQNGACSFTSCIGDKKETVERVLNEYPVFIRDIIGLKLIKKIQKLRINNGKTLSSVVSQQTPFGIITSYKPTDFGTPCWFRQKVGLKYVNPKDVNDYSNIIGKYKLLIPEAPIAGQTDFTKPVGLYYEGNVIEAKPGECCSQTWLVANSFDSSKEVKFFKSYLLTKVVRFLILQVVISQHVSREKFCFVPDLGTYDQIYTDEFLRKEWNITDEEWAYIDGRIHNYGIGED